MIAVVEQRRAPSPRASLTTSLSLSRLSSRLTPSHMDSLGSLATLILSGILAYSLWIVLLKKSERPTLRSVAILVLGDIGRSPRMMYHAESFADNNFETFLIGYGGQFSIDYDYVLCLLNMYCRFATSAVIVVDTACPHPPSFRDTNVSQKLTVFTPRSHKSTIASMDNTVHFVDTDPASSRIYYGPGSCQTNMFWS